MNPKLTYCFCLVFLTTHSIQAQYLDQIHEFITQNEFSKQNSEWLDSLIESNINNVSSIDLADGYHDVGFLWYYKKGWLKTKDQKDLNQSIHFFTLAANAKRNIDGLDTNSLKRSLYNRGYMYTLQGRYFEAIGSFKEIIEITEHNKLTLAAYRELGKSYIFINDFHNALDSFDQLIFLGQNESNYTKGLVEGYYRRAETYALLNEQMYSDQIRLNLRKADSIWNAQTNGISSVFKNDILQLEGNRLLSQGEYTESIKYFDSVLNGLSPSDVVNYSIVYNSIGSAYLLLNNYDAATATLNKSITYNPNNSLPYQNLGDVYLQQDSINRALEIYHKAIVVATGLSSDSRIGNYLTKDDLQIASKKYFLLEHLLAKANALMEYFRSNEDTTHLDTALATFFLADQLVDIIRFESYEYRSKLYWREKAASLYLSAVEVCYLLDKSNQAYYFMEKNKAILLLEDISNEQAKKNSEIPLEVAAREWRFKQNIALQKGHLMRVKDQTADSIQQVKNEVYASKRSHEKFIDSLKIAFPIYAATKQKIDLLGYEIFKKNYLSDKEAVAHYILNDQKGFGMIHTADQSYLFEIDSVAQLHSDIYRLTEQLSKAINTKSELIAYDQLSHRVFQSLFPDSSYLLIKDKKLIVIPDYSLQKLSFETLNIALEPQYLINEVEINYAYSMSHLHSNANVRREAPYDFVGFAPISFGSQGLQRLDKSEQEVLSLQALTHGHSILFQNATKQRFLDTVNQYRIVHLASHANIENGQDPWIAFYDDKLSLSDIYATKNQSDMIVLSACKTSLGEIKKGEGVMSFARAFFYAGTNSVISSLWSTNDKSNQEIMVDFYKGLDQGLSKSEALRKAKLQYIQVHTGVESSPFYWGALILIGDDSPLKLSKPRVGLYWIISLILSIMLVAFFIIYNRRNSKDT